MAVAENIKVVKPSLEDTLIIFVKYPKAGLVKTRLARTVGKRSAAIIYKNIAELIVRRTQSDSFRRQIFYTPYSKRKEVIMWLGKDLEYYPQQGKNLGTRLANAFKLVFKKGAKRAVVIGSDSPLIEAGIIRKTFRKLKSYDGVIGPSLDGGYYLLGLSCFYKEIFDGIDWGTDKVFKQTLYRIKKLKLKLSILEENFDIDELQDLRLLSLLMPELNQLPTSPLKVW